MCVNKFKQLGLNGMILSVCDLTKLKQELGLTNLIQWSSFEKCVLQLRNMEQLDLSKHIIENYNLTPTSIVKNNFINNTTTNMSRQTPQVISPQIPINVFNQTNKNVSNNTKAYVNLNEENNTFSADQQNSYSEMEEPESLWKTELQLKSNSGPKLKCQIKKPQLLDSFSNNIQPSSIYSEQIKPKSIRQLSLQQPKLNSPKISNILTNTPVSQVFKPGFNSQSSVDLRTIFGPKLSNPINQPYRKLKKRQKNYKHPQQSIFLPAITFSNIITNPFAQSSLLYNSKQFVTNSNHTKVTNSLTSNLKQNKHIYCHHQYNHNMAYDNSHEFEDRHPNDTSQSSNGQQTIYPKFNHFSIISSSIPKLIQTHCDTSNLNKDLPSQTIFSCNQENQIMNKLAQTKLKSNKKSCRPSSKKRARQMNLKETLISLTTPNYLTLSMPIDYDYDSSNEECTCHYWFKIDETKEKCTISEPSLHVDTTESSTNEDLCNNY